MAAKAPKLIIESDDNYQVPPAYFWISLIAKNGKTVLTSETFPTRAHAVRARARAIELIRDESLQVP